MGMHTSDGDAAPAELPGRWGQGARARRSPAQPPPPLTLRQSFAPLIERLTRLFAGRDEILAQLGAFSQRRQGSYLLLTAPAGFGKSALLAALAARQPDACAYHFCTSELAHGLSEGFFLRNVVQQLAAWHGDRASLAASRRELALLYRELLQKAPRTPRLLLLDGLDALAAGSLRPYLPEALPRHVHIVLALDDGGQPWQELLAAYGLPAGRTERLQLGGLSPEEVAAVLLAAGGPAGHVAAQPALLEELLRVTAAQEAGTAGCDPLFVRLLAEELAEGRLAPETLAGQPAGLRAYLDQCWEAPQRLDGWQDAQRDLLGTLSVALGPLRQHELEAIQPGTLGDPRHSGAFAGLIGSVRRFVAGSDEQGYSLSHSRLRSYLRGRLDLAPYQQQLLAWCQSYEQRGWRGAIPAYILQHYARHLAQVGQPLDQLLSRRWMQVSFEQTNSYDSFAEGVEQALTAAGAQQPPDLVRVIRFSLLAAHLKLASIGIPPLVLGVLAQLGQAARAGRYAAVLQDAEQRLQAACLIGEVLLAHGGQQELADARAVLLQALDSIGDRQGFIQRYMQAGPLIPLLARAGAPERALLEARRWSAKSQLSQLAQLAEAAGAVEQVRAVWAAAADAAYEQDDPWARKGSWAQFELLRAVAAACLGQEAQFLEALEVQRHGAALSCVALAALVTCLADRGMPDRARALIRQELGVLGGGMDPEPAALLRLAEAYLQALAGPIEQALATAAAVHPVELQLQFLVLIASALAAQGRDREAATVWERLLSALETLESAATLKVVLLDVFCGLIDSGAEKSSPGLLERAAAAAARRDDDLAAWELALALRNPRPLQRAGALGEWLAASLERLENDVERIVTLRSATLLLLQAGQPERALLLAERCTDASERGMVLELVASALAQAGQPERALAVVERIDVEHEHFNALGAVAQALAQAGQLERALAMAEQLPAGKHRLQALDAVVQVLAQAGQLERALAVAGRIDAGQARAQALGVVAQALLQAGQVEQAAALAERAVAAALWGAQEPSWRDTGAQARALEAVAQALARAGQPERAVAVAERVTHKGMGSWARLGGAVILARVGQAGLAAALAEQVLAGPEPAAPEQDKLEALGVVVETLAEAGQAGRAVALAEQAMALAGRMANAPRQAQALSTIVVLFTRLGLPERAVAVAEQAAAVAERIPDQLLRAETLARLAAALEQAGQPGLMRALAERAALAAEGYRIERTPRQTQRRIVQVLAGVAAPERLLALAERLQDETSRNWALELAAPALALDQLERALGLVERISNPRQQASVVDQLVEVLARAGQLERALEVTEWAADMGNQADVLGQVALALARADQPERALEVANRIKSPHEHARTLKGLAQALLQAGQARWAAAVAEQAAALVEHVEDERLAVQVLQGAAVVLAQVGQPEQAARLLEPIADEDMKWAALNAIIQGLARAGQPERAFEVAERIGSPAEYVSMLKEVAEALSPGGQAGRVAALVGQATALARRVEDASLAQVGQPEQAARLLEPVADPWPREAALSAIIQTLLRAGQVERALDVAEQAIGLAGPAADGSPQPVPTGTAAGRWARGLKAHALTPVFAALVPASQEPRSRRLVGRAFELVRLQGYAEVLDLLRASAPLLVGLDQGETLWQVALAMQELEGW